ncbi:MAG: UTP--glucose-1-phosphate uridylyltransferase [Planctomycetes bacterium]|nr:UTP--glucose-1-phosphate uridylyltransferase [Planctomycetota bacterium]
MFTAPPPDVPDLIAILEADQAPLRDTPIEAACAGRPLADLLATCAQLERFRHRSDNLYQRVRALLFLYAIHRFHLPAARGIAGVGAIPYSGYRHLLARRFEESIEAFLNAQQRTGPSDALCSALATAYHQLAFQTLADQVRRSVRSVRGNGWMFRIGHPADQPLRVREELLHGDPYPVLREQTPVRMDLSHSGWSDIFFLGMDYPEGARVLNVSIDLGVRNRDAEPRPPIEAWLRVLDEPVLRLTSADLGATADLTTIEEVFDFAKDHLGLLKAAVIAAGLVPPGVEGSGESLPQLLARMAGPGRGIELCSYVRDIPKGSRLAVSTNLLGSLITVCMRATGQTAQLTGGLHEAERRTVAARAILGEWLGGSGGGWQDSGGIWPGIKLLCGRAAAEGDPEFGISRGRLLPEHHLMGPDEIDPRTLEALQSSLVLAHGGMAQNVGPILEMVTERYLLRGAHEWQARHTAGAILDEIVSALRRGDVPALADATTRNFTGPIQSIIPWATNAFTEAVLDDVRGHHGADFLGFCMLGGMSGGGMGFFFTPQARAAAQERLLETLSAHKRDLQSGLPFAMDPVVYEFAVNGKGTWCTALSGVDLPDAYFGTVLPPLLERGVALPPARRKEVDAVLANAGSRPRLAALLPQLVRGSVEAGPSEGDGDRLRHLLENHGFDRQLHEQIRTDLRAGRIGLPQNRLPANTSIADVEPGDVRSALGDLPTPWTALGEAALRRGEVAVVSLAAGAGSRWTHGAGVVKALHPFCRLGGRHRTFVEVHLAKSRRVGEAFGCVPAHLFTTSYLTHQPIAAHLAARADYHYPGRLLLSPGRAVGLRLVPMARDLRFAFEEMPQQRLDEQAQKVRDSLHEALIAWAQRSGEASDYTDNLPQQCMHPVGHWFEVPNLLRNGVLRELLTVSPQLRHLLVHNIDTLGATLDPGLLGAHIDAKSCLTFEVIPRRIDDRGGGLARVDGRPRLVEGLAMPREQDEFALSYYNTLTSWVDLDRLLAVFELDRDDVLRGDEAHLSSAIRRVGARLPTYITLKDVKKRWGHGQEDVFPVAQFEKLWGDLTALSDVPCSFVVVPRHRGQQLKDPAQLDGWLRDGSAAHIAADCGWAADG